MSQDHHEKPSDLMLRAWRLICTVMRNTQPAKRIASLAWLLLLKCLEDHFERSEKQNGGAHEPPVIGQRYRWSEWVPEAVQVSHWDDERLLLFLREDLFPYLGDRKYYSGSPIAKTLSSVFHEGEIVICTSTDTLRELLTIVNELNFQEVDTRNCVSSFYQQLLQQLELPRVVARDCFVPQEVVKFMVQAVDPDHEATVYDPACGTGVFLVEVLKQVHQRLSQEYSNDRAEVLYGNALDKMSALLSATNMALAGEPLVHISCNSAFEIEISPPHANGFDIILTNPPFGTIEDEVTKQVSTPKKEYNEPLVLVQCMDTLCEDGGLASVIVSSSVLYRGARAFVDMRKRLLREFELLMVIGLPEGTFEPYTKTLTSILFFRRQRSTRQDPLQTQKVYTTNETLYYDLPLSLEGESPLSERHFAEIQRSWEKWLVYQSSKGSYPELPSTSWIERFDDDAFASNKYRLGTQRPYLLTNEVPPAPLELFHQMLEHRKHFSHILANLQAVHELDERLAESNRRLYQILNDMQERLTNGEEIQ